LICFCKFLISSAWASIILSFSDERFILNFFKSDFLRTQNLHLLKTNFILYYTKTIQTEDLGLIIQVREGSMIDVFEKIAKRC
jgi:hypothetical protein